MFSGIGIILIAGIILAYLKKKGTAKVVSNHYNKKLYIKPEVGELDTLEAQQTGKNIDGIQIAGNKNQIRKFRNGVNVKVDKTGQAKAVNFISRIVGQEDFTHKQLPQNWDKLFEAIKQ